MPTESLAHITAPNGATTMTDTVTSIQRRYAADSPLAYLLELAADADVDSEDEQRDDAQTAAAHHIYERYADSLARALEVMDWQGYPAWTGVGGRQEPSAVAWLDGGLWLHHTLRITEADGALDVLTLIVPCTCGRGYVDISVEYEHDLIEILAELRPTHGHAPHTDTPVTCHSVRTYPAPLRTVR
ncbi:hypothetical protein QF037_009947 [Streptomyces canus]|uniref:hypothetical protein n=1 Tax=Streptomyces canus TaxID=58343 RepID=UPI002780F26B|nr:hypothetical protein [Streptomyces canus]MDQ0605514.1 hypothetical protein [Streptomyces canus]